VNILIDEQKFKENYEILSDYKFDFEMEKRCIDYIKNKKGNQLSCMRTLSSGYKVLASKNLLIENNLNSFRLNCHISEKLKILGTSKESRLYKASYSLFGLIMSNNKEWISFLKNNLNYITSNDFNSKENTYIKSKDLHRNSFLSKTTILALLGDFEEVEKRSKKYLEEPLTKSYYAYTKYDFMFFEALVNKNTEKMKRAIHKLLEPKIAKKILFDTDINYSFYLNIYVLMYSKIALLHGFDLGINDKTAPKNLIDNTSLQSYEEPYDFMKKIDLVTLTPEKWKEWTENYSIIVPIT